MKALIITLLALVYSCSVTAQDEDTIPSREMSTATKVVTSNSEKTPRFQFRGKLFSDYAGVDDDLPNGLLQANFYISYQRNNVVFSKVFGETLGVTLFRTFVLADVTFSKIVTDDRFLNVQYYNESNSDTTLRLVNRTDIYNYSDLILSGKANIITFKVSDDFYLYGDYFITYYRTPIRDTLKSIDAPFLHVSSGVRVSM